MVEAGFAEQHFGAWQGLTYDAVHKETGEAAWRTPSTIQPPGGESYETVVSRVAGAMERIGLELSNRDVVVVAHAGSIRAALAKALGLTPDRALALSIDPLSVTSFAHHGGDAWSVDFVNRLP
jgi:alpha-ribazole phosphatase